MSSPYTKPTLVKSKIRDMFANNQNLIPSIDIGADGSEQTISTDPTANSSSATVTNDPSGSKPGTSPSATLTPEQARIKNRRTHEQAFGKDPITQFREAKRGVKIKKSRIRDNFKAEKQKIKKEEYNKAVNQGQISLRKPRIKEAKQQNEKIKKTFRATRNNKALVEKDDKIKVVNKNRAKRMSEKGWTETPLNFNNTMNYLDNNAQQQMDPNSSFQDPTNPTGMQPNRAGRPINSNILTNDPNNYQDPSKVSAQQNIQNQMFGGLAQSVGDQNPKPMIPGEDNNQSVTPGQKSPFNKKNWIQDVNKDIDKRGTRGVCTGDKFGSESCPPGSKRYNLAKTFKKMNKN